MNVLLYRRSLALRSGAAQLMLMQAAGLEAAGANVRFAGERRRWKFLLATGRYASKLTTARAGALARRPDSLIVDHEAALPDPDIVFVHNLAAALAAALPRAVPESALEAEARFFATLGPDVQVVANSALVARGLERHFSLPGERISVHHPGYDETRFSAAARSRLRPAARAGVGIEAGAPLIGLVTSGHFDKRGLGDFLEAARIVHSARPDVRFLIVGSKRLPAAAARHPLVEQGIVMHRPKTGRPEAAFAALDIMLYPAVYEEFGMVVAEAQAMGVPVVVTDRVGAAETLPRAYREWGLPAAEPAALAHKCIELIENPSLAGNLAAAAGESIGAFASRQYAAATADTILRQKRRLR